MLSAMMLIVVSCSKSREEPKDENTACQLTESARSYSDSDYKWNESFSYDDKGRIIKIVERDGTDVGVIDYVYSATEIKQMDHGYILTYKLDANNRIVSDSEGYTYSYDDKGYLVGKSMNNGANYIVTIKYTYTNDNLVKIVEEVFDNYVTTTYTDTYEYGTEEAGSNFINPWSGDVGLPLELSGILGGYIGKSSKNLVTKHTGRYDSGTFSYTKDVSGNITKTTISSTSGSSKTTIEHKYNCK